MDADAACPPVVLAASGPAEDVGEDKTVPYVPPCMFFTSGCIPEGWSVCTIEDFGFEECETD